jgi:Trk-type K+ transport system membrane component
MIETMLWTMVIGIVIGFLFIIGGLVYATIYDAWYRRKYATWIALQEDEND